LALVASSRDDGIARDRALALLWPELDSDRARNNLKQLVFSLRRALAPDAIIANGGALRLDPNVITVDVWAYEKAITDGALESAVARYGGPFLDGFSVPGLTEFERWVETERERLARMHAQTLDTLADRAHRAGQFEIAAAWRRHLAALDPLSARYAVAFVRALADAGDVPGALRHAHLFERLVRSELDADVGPEMRLLVAQLRLRAESSTSRAITSAELEVLAPEGDATPTRQAAVTPSTASTFRARFANAVRAVMPKVNPRRFAIVWLAVADVIVFGLAGRSRLLGPTAAMGEVAPDVPATIAVFTLDGRGSALTGELSRATAELLTTSLDGGTGLTAVTVPADAQPAFRTASGDSVVIDAASASRTATRLGARLFVLGRIVEVGGRLRLTATMHDRLRTDPPLARASAEGPANEMFEVIDNVASQLLAGRFPGTRGALARVAASSAASLPAAKAYFAAEQQMGTGRYSAALDALRDAVRLDSGFAIGYYRMSRAAELNGDETAARDAALAAVRSAQRLDDHYRHLLLASAARHQGDVAAAERDYSGLTLNYPNDADAWFGLGEALFHLNAIRGRSPLEAREAFLKVVELDPRHVEALVHLARIEALRGDSAQMDHWLGSARQYTTDEVLSRIALHVRALGGVDRQRLQRASSVHGGPSTREILANTDPAHTDQFTKQFLAADIPGDLAAYGHRLAAWAASARGQYRDALRHLGEALESGVDADMQVRSLIVATPGSAVDSATIAETRIAVERWQPSYLREPDPPADGLARGRMYALLRLHRLGVLALRAGDTVSASKLATRLSTTEPDSETTPTASALALSLRARIAAVAGDSAQALRLLERVEWTRVGLLSEVEPMDRLLRADLLAATGRSADAVRWYSTIGNGAPQELPLVGFATLGLARAYDRIGERTAATNAYRTVATLWRDADPPLKAIASAALVAASPGGVSR
jgi:DNA-binding SARP family transcriptional activator/tetratricopeptide (TPR) repeat protein